MVLPDIDRRIAEARDAGLPRKPLPSLLIICRVLRDAWDGTGSDGSFAFPDESSRGDAMRDLRRGLDRIEPAEYGGWIADWAKQRKARWIASGTGCRISGQRA